ncbi:MAG: glycosyltransferase family 39 protein [Pseudomonadota bacterium]
MFKHTLKENPLPIGRYLLIGFLLIAGLKIVLAAALDLYSDEIFYWQASTRPALAYSDLPFMAALLSGLGTTLFGNSAFAVRTFFLLLGTSIPLLIYWVASPLMPRRQAQEAAALSLCLPLGAFLGLLAVPDVPLLFLGLLLIGSLERATRLNSITYWLATGAVAALGVSTHYRFALYILAGFIFLVSFKDLHRHWKSPGLWLAFGLLLLGLYPTLAFNLNNQLSGIDYHLLERHPWEFQAEGLLHPFKQALLVTPLLYAALLYTLFVLLQKARQGDSRHGLFAVFALVNLGVYLVLAPWADSTRTSIHWPLSGYLPLLVFLPETLREFHQRLSSKFGIRQASRLITVTVALGFMGSVVALLGVGSQSLQEQLRPLLGKGVLSNKMAGWRELNDHVNTLLERQTSSNDWVLITDNYYTGAQLELGLDAMLPIYNIDTDKAVRDGRAVQYELWGNNATGLIRETGRNALFISEDSTLTVPDKIATLARACSQLARLEFIEQLTLFDGEKIFSFYKGEQIGGSATGPCPLPTLGWLDQPQPGQEITGTLELSGWAINEGLGVRGIEVLINDQVIGTANYGIPRADVVDAMGVKADPNAPNLGFNGSLPLDSVAEGEARLTLRVVGNSGEVQVFGARNITVTR